MAKAEFAKLVAELTFAITLITGLPNPKDAMLCAKANIADRSPYRLCCSFIGIQQAKFPQSQADAGAKPQNQRKIIV